VVCQHDGKVICIFPPAGPPSDTEMADVSCFLERTLPFSSAREEILDFHIHLLVRA
jgi:hypothetical protein